VVLLLHGSCLPLVAGELWSLVEVDGHVHSRDRCGAACVRHCFMSCKGKGTWSARHFWTPFKRPGGSQADRPLRAGGTGIRWRICGGTHRRGGGVWRSVLLWRGMRASTAACGCPSHRWGPLSRLGFLSVVIFLLVSHCQDLRDTTAKDIPSLPLCRPPTQLLCSGCVHVLGSQDALTAPPWAHECAPS
jgi:hypothetical protein